MIKILGFILLPVLFLFLCILLIGLVLFSGFFRAVFRQRRRNPNEDYQQPRRSETNSNSYNTNGTDSTITQDPNERNHKKIFGKDEGEYVDFEEIK